MEQYGTLWICCLLTQHSFYGFAYASIMEQYGTLWICIYFQAHGLYIKAKDNGFHNGQFPISISGQS